MWLTFIENYMIFSQVQSEMSKLREHLDDCEKYKTFLDSLTPEEYFNDQRNQKYERAKERMESRRGKKTEETRIFFFFFF